MILDLSTDKNIEKFYKKLWLYKSFIYKNIEFITNDKVNYEIDCIINALNIKNRKERITFIYDIACKTIDDKYKGINICGFNNNICYAHKCLNSNKFIDGCCRKCLYKTHNGCPSSNLACKLFNCSEVKKRYDMLEFNDLKILSLLSLKNKVVVKHDYFSLREDVLKDLYSYFFTYSIIRILLRLINNRKKFKKLFQENKKSV